MIYAVVFFMFLVASAGFYLVGKSRGQAAAENENLKNRITEDDKVNDAIAVADSQSDDEFIELLDREYGKRD